MSNTENMRKLIKLLEAEGQILSQEEQDTYDIALADARMAREKKIVDIIRRAFNKLGLSKYMDDDSIYYDEEDDRTATVQLDGEIPLKELCHLYAAGLAEEYKIGMGTAGISVNFIVKEDMDHAIR